MIPSTSLRHRIIKASLAMTFVVCLLFSAGLFLAFEFAEESLLEEHLESDMNTFIDHYTVAPEIATLPRDNFAVYVEENGDRSHFPNYLKNLPEGEEDVELNGKKLDVDVRQRQQTRFFFVIEETEIDSFENILIISVIIIIGIICICSIFLSFAFANRIIKPVTDLATQVNQLENTGASIDVSDTQSQDEITVLSEAIDSFQLRVGELLGREREFSSDASHELRTPLMGIQAAAENLQIGDSSTRTIELAQRIEARCKQMRALIDSMLFLARDPHSLENDFEPVALINIVKDQIESASPHIDSKGVETLIIENGKPVVFTSAAILSVVFGNLLRNAVIHSQSKDIHIEISSHGFSIKDFGRGIAPELKEKMFERYTNGNSDSSEGVGIGLSLVKRLCDHFNWELTVESDTEVGTCISVNFQNSIQS
jgi:signal transduction histidine kinase